LGFFPPIAMSPEFGLSQLGRPLCHGHDKINKPKGGHWVGRDKAWYNQIVMTSS